MESTANLLRDIITPLKTILPLELREYAEGFAELLVGVTSGEVSPNDIEKCIENNHKYIALLKELNGKTINTRNALVTFGQDNQIGDISIRDIIKGHSISLTFNITSDNNEKLINKRGHFNTISTSLLFVLLIGTAGFVVFRLVYQFQMPPVPTSFNQQLVFETARAQPISESTLVQTATLKPQISTPNSVDLIYGNNGNNGNKELQLVWENSKLRRPNDKGSVILEEQNEDHFTLKVTTESVSSTVVPWQIQSKREALELVAIFISGMYSDKELAKRLFLGGLIQNLTYDYVRMSTSLQFRVSTSPKE